jgi:hypothetical protein
MKILSLDREKAKNKVINVLNTVLNFRAAVGIITLCRDNFRFNYIWDEVKLFGNVIRIFYRGILSGKTSTFPCQPTNPPIR